MDERFERLRESLSRADEAGLLLLVSQHLGDMPVGIASAALRNPFAGRQLVELLCSNRGLLRSTTFRREVVGHRATAEVRALRLISGLGWRDLIEVGGNVRVRPTVRRAANLQVASRLPGLAGGERVIIARRASAELIRRLVRDLDRRVIAALLENPRLTEVLLMPLLSSTSSSPDVLKQVADDALWNRRKAVQRALCRNPKTPPATASALLPSIGKIDLRAVAADGRITESVRAKARALLGGNG